LKGDDPTGDLVPLDLISDVMDRHSYLFLLIFINALCIAFYIKCKQQIIVNEF